MDKPLYRSMVADGDDPDALHERILVDRRR